MYHGMMINDVTVPVTDFDKALELAISVNFVEEGFLGDDFNLEIKKYQDTKNQQSKEIISEKLIQMGFLHIKKRGA